MIQHFPVICSTLLVRKGGSGERGAKSAILGFAQVEHLFKTAGSAHPLSRRETKACALALAKPAVGTASALADTAS
jgi:hypothetical protein